MPCDRAWAAYGQVLEPLLMLSGDGGKTSDPPIPVVPEANRKGWACEECDAADRMITITEGTDGRALRARAEIN